MSSQGMYLELGALNNAAHTEAATRKKIIHKCEKQKKHKKQVLSFAIIHGASVVGKMALYR